MRRLQGFTISLEAVARVASEYGYAPQEAAFVRAYFHNDRNVIVLVMEHPDFENLPEGCAIPIDVATKEAE